MMVFASGNFVFAQKSFEGKVTYKFQEATGKSEMRMDAYFGKQKIKAILKESDSIKNGKDDLLIDFTKGIIYHLNSTNKTYRADSMKNFTVQGMPAVTPASGKSKNILGYHATEFTGLDTSKSEFMVQMNFTIWYADSLYFPFDKAYANKDMIPMFGNGSTISMGMEIDKYFLMTPVSVEPQSLPGSIFSVPADYLQEQYFEPAADSVMAELKAQDSALKASAEIMLAADSVLKAAVDEAAIKIKKKAKKSTKQNTKKQPQKNSALKSKE